MKRFGKTLLTATLTIAMVVAGSLSAFAATPAASTAPKVMLNGEYVAFTDAVPQNVNGRIMVPFTAILESLGAKVNYDKTTQTVSASTSETAISFVIGKSDIQVKQGDKTSITKMDVTPYVDSKTNRTYVSSRFMAESFGYSVGYDAAQKAVIIVDFDKLFANADKDFSVISKLMTSDMDMTKVYKSTGDFKMNMGIYTSALAEGTTNSAIPDKMEMSMSGTMDGLQQKANASMAMTLAMDISKMLPTMTAAEKAELQPIMDALKNMQFNVKMNGETGIIYMNSPLFTKLMGVADNTWMKIDAFEMYKEMGVDLQKIMSLAGGGNMSTKDLLLMMANASSSSYTVDTYKDVTAVYNQAKAVIGDNAFTKSTSGNTDTYTLKTDTAVLKAAGITKAELVIKTQSDKLTGYTAGIAATVKDTATKEDMTVSFDLTGDMTTTKMTMKMALPKMLDMDMTMNTKVEPSTGTVDINPPAGANIMDMDALLKESLKTN